MEDYDDYEGIAISVMCQTLMAFIHLLSLVCILSACGIVTFSDSEIPIFPVSRNEYYTNIEQNRKNLNEGYECPTTSRQPKTHKNEKKIDNAKQCNDDEIYEALAIPSSTYDFEMQNMATFPRSTPNTASVTSNSLIYGNISDMRPDQYHTLRY